MLCDFLVVLREQMLPLVRPEDQPEMILTFRMAEMEARNMEDRIHYLTGRPHAALDGRLVSTPAPVIEIGAFA